MKKTTLLSLVVLCIFASCSKSNENPDDSNEDLSPSHFSISLEEVNDKSATIVWTASKDPENKVVSYDIYLNGQLVESQTKALTVTFEELLPETNYTGMVVAFDGENSTSINFSFTTQILVPMAFVGNVFLGTQQEVIDFGENRYGSIEGSLKIGWFDTNLPVSDINDLSHLSDLTEVSGSIEIYSTQLKTFEGLNNLVSIGVDLFIVDNSLLVDLEALESLKTITELLSIARNASLSSLGGLQNLTEVESIIIHDCDSLQNLNGLQNANEVSSSLVIERNDLLTDIAALNQISSLEYLNINENASLQNIDGLDNLTKVGIILRIIDNSSLVDLRGLSRLSSVGENSTGTSTSSYGLKIFNNPLLENLDGLQSLIKVSGDLHIVEHSNLLNLKGLNNLIEVTGGFWLYQNDSLENLDDLENLNSIHSDLRIFSNSSITNLDGLSVLRRIGSTIQITDNPGLTSICGLQDLFSNIEENPALSISGNAFDLNGGVTRQDIIDGNCSL